MISTAPAQLRSHRSGLEMSILDNGNCDAQPLRQSFVVEFCCQTGLEFCCQTGLELCRNAAEKPVT